MINTLYLDEKIKESGKKKGYLAERCGLSRQGFLKKCKNESDFTTRQVDILCDELCITKLTEKESIFFAKDVAKIGNI